MIYYDDFLCDNLLVQINDIIMDLYPLIKSIFKGGLKILDYVVDGNKYINLVAYKSFEFIEKIKLKLKNSTNKIVKNNKK